MQTRFLWVSLILLVFPAREKGFVEAGHYYVYSCPLHRAVSSSCSSIRKRYAPYGIRHTFIKIGSTCYDWGIWNYPRQIDCNDSALSCCYRFKRLERRQFTWCADDISEFETAWRNEGKNYNLFTWNCQIYSDKMSEFLETCDTSRLFE
ncbi:uncharacterized protein LOC132729380 [Ruditapes philippinarum]|uniref:uncharacterized protein LOC132729380 n=1 Tax=Ruditapes philippinarum TaxID=129788 RepID=UPI00295B91F7|nr:uncharacterized protein LOC132729380 [Ruditapes philippinarum]